MDLILFGSDLESSSSDSDPEVPQVPSAPISDGPIVPVTTSLSISIPEPPAPTMVWSDHPHVPREQVIWEEDEYLGHGSCSEDISPPSTPTSSLPGSGKSTPGRRNSPIAEAIFGGWKR